MSIMNCFPGGGLYAASGTITLTDGNKCFYGTIPANRVNFKLMHFITATSYVRFYDATLHYEYSIQRQNIVYVGPDGIPYTFNDTGWGRAGTEGSAASVEKATLGGVEYAKVKINSSDYYPYCIWFHADGSIRIWKYDKYNEESVPTVKWIALGE